MSAVSMPAKKDSNAATRLALNQALATSPASPLYKSKVQLNTPALNTSSANPVAPKSNHSVQKQQLTNHYAAFQQDSNLVNGCERTTSGQMSSIHGNERSVPEPTVTHAIAKELKAPSSPLHFAYPRPQTVLDDSKFTIDIPNSNVSSPTKANQLDQTSISSLDISNSPLPTPSRYQVTQRSLYNVSSLRIQNDVQDNSMALQKKSMSLGNTNSFDSTLSSSSPRIGLNNGSPASPMFLRRRVLGRVRSQDNPSQEMKDLCEISCIQMSSNNSLYFQDDAVHNNFEHKNLATSENGTQNGLITDCTHSPSVVQAKIERLGELSRDEDEFDFAILLKPSKIEELSSEATVSIAVGGELDKDNDNKFEHHKNWTTRKTSRLRKAPSNIALSQDLSREELFHRISRTGLIVKRLLSLDGKQILLKVKAPQQLLETGAERLKMRKLRRFDQVWMEFSNEWRETYEDWDNVGSCIRFIDSEKQRIVHALLTSSDEDIDIGSSGTYGAGLNHTNPLRLKHIEKMFPLHKHKDLLPLRQQWIKYWTNPNFYVIKNISKSGSEIAVAASHSETSCEDKLGIRGDLFFAYISPFFTHVLFQPIDLVAQYFGEKVAFYFAWTETYTRWLIWPSIAGVILFVLQIKSGTLDHPAAPAYAIFMSLWTSAFLIAWKRQAATLAYRWGTLGYEQAECTRAEFYGDQRYSTDSEKIYPVWKRYLKYTITIPSIIISISVLLASTYYAFSTRDALEEKSIHAKAEASELAADIVADLKKGMTLDKLKRISEFHLDWYFWFYFFATPLLYGALIPAFNYLFTKWATLMNNWENHATETSYQSHLIIKVFSFRFVHVFASMYYYSFAGRNREDHLLRVGVQLASFMIAGQSNRIAMQTIGPCLLNKYRNSKKKQLTNEQFNRSNVFNQQGMPKGDGYFSTKPANTCIDSRVNQNAVIHEQCVRLEQASDKAWEEANLSSYSTFEDYTEMLIQFGYVSFFSLAFPLAPLLALINNVLELRTDAYKLCRARQRPLAEKSSDIGVWFQVLQFMSVLAVITNCFHIAFTTKQFDTWALYFTFSDMEMRKTSTAEKIWLVFALEHILVGIKIWMMLVIPAIPLHVKKKLQIERENTKRESARAIANRLKR